MAATAPDLPTRFPCWCRAVYSWGGETEKDLGFMEGDLIECLNAGDGSWWVGRLRRDKRVMGSFPSNFVMVLDEGFQPASRAPSPMPEQTSNHNSRAPSPQPQAKQKSTACRKPFQGYKNANTAVQRHKSADQLRDQSQQHFYDPQNPPSTVLWAQDSSRPGRSPSPMIQDLNSSPPPPPPPHRVAVADSRSRPCSPLPPAHGARYRRTPSPDIASMHGHTPPMVRNAMDDVMSSLEDMTRAEQQEPASTFNPWSPEAFDVLSRPNPGRTITRPKSALDFGIGSGSVSDRFNRGHQQQTNVDGPPQLNNYVQRMESRLRRMQDERMNGSVETFESRDDGPPAVPAKDVAWNHRPASSMAFARPALKARKSAYELGRTSTYKSTTTNSSSGVQSNATNTSTATSMTGQSVFSAGGISATSAGSLARRSKLSLRRRPVTAGGGREEAKLSNWATGASDQSNSARSGARSAVGWENKNGFGENHGGLGGFSAPKQKKSGFFKKLFDGSKTVAASARSSIAVGSTTSSPTKSRFGVASMPNSHLSQESDAAREMGLGGGNVDWVHVRRDVNRSNTPGPVERQERADRCQMLDHPVISPIDELCETIEGEEDAHGQPVLEAFQLSNPSFTGVDKAARFITSLPPMITPASLAQGYICRPHRSDIQRLRAIFTWTSERVGWDEDFDGEMDSRRVIQTKRGCSHEVAILVYEMCSAIGIHSEIVRGYLKSPGEDLDLDASVNRPNHYWNAVLVDHEWRMLDCSLASPTNPRRPLYTSISSSIAEPFYFLTRPLELCYTHVPTDSLQQHIIPPIAHDVLLSLPCALPPYFWQKSQLYNYDTSLVRLEGLELATVTLNVSSDTEVVAEVESRSYLRDSDGDVYENVDAVVRKRALAQASWYSPPSSTGASDMVSKRYTIKALLPSDETSGTLKIYAGKRGLMHSSKDIPHPLALALPLFHTGDNPPYDFLTRHPTPHAMRQDLYVIQPQCRRLAVGETFVFSVRQHTASATTDSPDPSSSTMASARPVSPNPFARPASAMSMMSMSVAGSASNSGSNSSDPNANANAVATAHGVRIRDKAAKLAVQSPAGKILKLNRKAEHAQTTVERGGGGESDGWAVQGSVWETVVKVQERGVWRGLVLADRSARWCVWGEWECL